jgi:hypothetical protein
LQVGEGCGIVPSKGVTQSLFHAYHQTDINVALGWNSIAVLEYLFNIVETPSLTDLQLLSKKSVRKIASAMLGMRNIKLVDNNRHRRQLEE